MEVSLQQQVLNLLKADMPDIVIINHLKQYVSEKEAIQLLNDNKPKTL
jgi:hypothetical protein